MSIRSRIKELEAQGYTGRTNTELDRLNRKQTDALSDDEILVLIKTRAKLGEKFGKLAAAARDRGLNF